MSDEIALRALDLATRDFGEAWARGDTDALRQMLSPTYTHMMSEGGFWIAMNGWHTLTVALARPHKSRSLMSPRGWWGLWWTGGVDFAGARRD
jgi:hypothetical protein